MLVISQSPALERVPLVLVATEEQSTVLRLQPSAALLVERLVLVTVWEEELARMEFAGAEAGTRVLTALLDLDSKKTGRLR